MKNAQLQTQETIIVLFIVVILIILGLAFFLRYQRQSITQERDDYERQQFQHLITTLPENPLLKCSRYGQKESCIDSLKVLAASRARTTLQAQYGTKTITLTQIYPPAPAIPCTRERPTDCGIWNLLTPSRTPTTKPTKAVTPISLYRPEHNSYVLATLTLDAYDL